MLRTQVDTYYMRYYALQVIGVDPGACQGSCRLTYAAVRVF
jgi:hypothetical protein